MRSNKDAKHTNSVILSKAKYLNQHLQGLTPQPNLLPKEKESNVLLSPQGEGCTDISNYVKFCCTIYNNYSNFS